MIKNKTMKFVQWETFVLQCFRENEVERLYMEHKDYVFILEKRVIAADYGPNTLLNYCQFYTNEIDNKDMISVELCLLSSFPLNAG